MKFKYQILVVTVLILMMLSFFSCGNGTIDEMNNDRPERHELACMLVDNVWKIVDAQDSSKTELAVSRGDTVVWHAPQNREIFFQFMDQELTGEYTQELLPGKSLTLVIGEKAKSGEHKYAVFVYGAKSFAKGESPPRMMILD